MSRYQTASKCMPLLGQPADVASLLSYLLAPWLSLPKWLWVPVGIFVTTIVFLFVIARRARSLEEPKLFPVCGSDRIFRKKENSDIVSWKTELRVGIRNASKIAIPGVELILANISPNDGTPPSDFNVSLREDNAQSTKITLNPNATGYYLIGNFIEPKSEEEAVYSPEEFMDWRRNGGNGMLMPHLNIGSLRIERGLYRLKLKFSGENSTESRMYFKIGINDNNELIFEPEQVTA